MKRQSKREIAEKLRKAINFKIIEVTWGDSFDTGSIEKIWELCESKNVGYLIHYNNELVVITNTKPDDSMNANQCFTVIPRACIWRITIR